MDFHTTARFAQHIAALRVAVEAGAEEGMARVVATAEEDARTLAGWNAPGSVSQTYGSTEWEWEVTDNSRRSISGYVVPKRRLNRIGSKVTTSVKTNLKTGRSFTYKHRHYADPNLAGKYNQEAGKVVGVVTMHAHNTPYLQEWERDQGRAPVTVEVFRANWSAFYFKMLAAAIEAACKATSP